jgi:osmoprotectant transport system substrate-binding protein
MNIIQPLRKSAVVIVMISALIVAGCGSSNVSSSTNNSGAKLIVGSQAYYSNEIVAEIYAQALESTGYEVDRQFQIGQREIYLPEIKTGKIDVFPEYIGSLLQALDKAATTGSTGVVFAQLEKSLPSGLTALSPAPASDQNSWTVTQAFATKHGLTDISSLSKVKEKMVVGGNAELETRPYGPLALKTKYGIKTAGFRAVEDSGGPLTVKALVEGDVQLANIYTADPNLKTNKLVALSDPDGLFFPDNITAVVSAKVDEKAKGILNKVNAALTQEDFVNLNSLSVNDKKSAKSIASDWLKKKQLT